MSQLGKPKTTTGCKTCKRVKCDEAKPSCARCIKAGRTCAGYDPWRNLAPTKRSPSPQSITTRLTADAEEDLYFRTFIEDGGSQSVVPSDVQFWKGLVPQLCEAEPSIRYASIAIGALMLQQRQSFGGNATPSKSALIYYNKSIQELLSPSAPVTKDVALISNLLFTCMECLQGHDSEALGLFHQGRRMFEEQWTSGNQTSVIISSVRSMLSRLRLVALLYGPPMADYRSAITGEDVQTPPGEGFASIEEARSSFFYLVGEAHDLISETQRAKLAHLMPFTITQAFSMECDRVKLSLQAWKARFLPMLEPALYHDEDSGEQIVVLTLLCHYYIIYVWIACCLQTGDEAYDEHIGSFQKILDTSKRVIDLLEKTGLKGQKFSMEIGLIAPLYLMGRLCRNPTMRRECLDLLRRGRRQEGLWESQLSISILERIIEIEEGGKPYSYPPNSARLKATLLHPRSTSPQGEQGNVVQFFLATDQPDKCWEVWEEWFKA